MHAIEASAFDSADSSESGWQTTFKIAEGEHHYGSEQQYVPSVCCLWELLPELVQASPFNLWMEEQGQKLLIDVAGSFI